MSDFHVCSGKNKQGTCRIRERCMRFQTYDKKWPMRYDEAPCDVRKQDYAGYYIKPKKPSKP